MHVVFLQDQSKPILGFADADDIAMHIELGRLAYYQRVQGRDRKQSVRKIRVSNPIDKAGHSRLAIAEAF